RSLSVAEIGGLVGSGRRASNLQRNSVPRTNRSSLVSSRKPVVRSHQYAGRTPEPMGLAIRLDQGSHGYICPSMARTRLDGRPAVWIKTKGRRGSSWVE